MSAWASPRTSEQLRALRRQAVLSPLRPSPPSSSSSSSRQSPITSFCIAAYWPKLCLASVHTPANAMRAQDEVAEQIHKLTYSGRPLDPLVEQCVDVTELMALALCLLRLPEVELFDGLRRSLRDLYVAQAGVPKDKLGELLNEHFGEHLTEKLRSQLFLAHPCVLGQVHKVCSPTGSKAARHCIAPPSGQRPLRDHHRGQEPRVTRLPAGAVQAF